MTIQTRLIPYTHEGSTLEAFLAYDDQQTGARPGVLVSHAWAGRGDFECDKAVLLASQGYVGLALDMYGQGVLGTSTEENAALMTPFLQDRARLQSRQQAALALLRQQPEVDPSRVAAIGFCFGGLCVLDLARSGADLRGVVSFHGLLMPADNLPSPLIKASVLALHGYDDPMAKPEALVSFANEMTQAGADWQAHAYGGTSHAFTNPGANDASLGLHYSARAEARALQSMSNFLAEVLA